MRALTTTLLAGALMLWAAGCARKAEKVDTAPFEAAVTSYLAQKSMGMAVTEFQSIAIEGEAAVAVCRLEESSGLYKMGVRWRFTFQRAPDGWKVTKHEAL